MDVTTRQSYVMAVVPALQRSAAAGVTGVARTIGAAMSPVFVAYSATSDKRFTQLRARLSHASDPVFVYTVHMEKFRVAEARARFGEILDRAEQGDDVFIERSGVRFRVSVERSAAAPASGAPAFAKVDPAVLNGEWSWALTARGVRFRKRRPAR